MRFNVTAAQVARVATAVLILDHVMRRLLRRCKPGADCCQQCRVQQAPEPVRVQPVGLLTS